MDGKQHHEPNVPEPESVTEELNRLRATLSERDAQCVEVVHDLRAKLDVAEGQLCVVKEYIKKKQSEYRSIFLAEIDTALSSAGPCRHEERIALLEKVAEDILSRLSASFPSATFVGKDYTVQDIRHVLRATLDAAKGGK